MNFCKSCHNPIKFYETNGNWFPLAHRCEKKKTKNHGILEWT